MICPPFVIGSLTTIKLRVWVVWCRFDTVIIQVANEESEQSWDDLTSSLYFDSSCMSDLVDAYFFSLFDSSFNLW